MSDVILHASLHFPVLPFVFSDACGFLTRVNQARVRTCQRERVKFKDF